MSLSEDPHKNGLVPFAIIGGDEYICLFHALNVTSSAGSYVQ